MQKYIIGHFRKCDMLTMSSTAMAVVGIVLTLYGHFTIAALCLFICGICDGFDGVLARKYKYSEAQKIYGAEMDSLSDVICFGVFPAVLTLSLNKSWYAIIICVFFVLCGLVRLAYFNMLSITKEGKKGKFVGVPITTSGVIYPIILFIVRLFNFEASKIVMPILLVILGILFIMRIEFPKPNIPELLNKIFNKYVVSFFLFPLLIVVFADLFFRGFNFKGNAVLATSLSIAHHLLPFLLILLLFIAISNIVLTITNNSKKTKMILLILTIIFMVINDIKFIIMGKPIVVSDVNFLNPDNIGMMGTAVTTIGPWIFKVIAKLVVFVVISILIIKMDKYHNFKFENKKKRIGTLIGSVIAIFIITFPIVFKDNFIQKYIYALNNDELSSFQSHADMFKEYGFFPSMYLDVISNGVKMPEDYSKEKAEKILNNVNDSNLNWGKANVVFILSESFFDLDNIDEISFDKNLTPNIDSYKNDSNALVTDLLVPTFGGTSVNTEYEILTGSPLSFLKAGYIPYNDYYTMKDSLAKNAPNIIKEFNNNGYETMYLTPWGNSSYNSEHTYDTFGVSTKKYDKDLKGNKKGTYYSDKSLMEDIYDELKDTDDNHLKFIMAASAQNHFPYSEDKYRNYDVNVSKTTLNKQATGMLHSYAQGVFDADKELNNLYEKIKSLDTKTIIVFFGDHLPYVVDNEGNNVLLNARYMKKDKDIRNYTTKAVILSNYPIEHEDIKYINANYLGAYIVNNLDLEISNYFKYVNNMRKVVPVFNRYRYYDINSNSFVLNEDKENKYLKNYRFVQYNKFYDR